MSALSEKLIKTLHHIQIMSDVRSGLYPGMRYEDAPMQSNRLIRMGYASSYDPHNPAHKTRVVITQQGREFLKTVQP